MPARDFIKLDRTQPGSATTHLGLLLEYIQSVRKSYELSQKVRGTMEHMTDGTVFTDLEAAFGIPTGKGVLVYDMVQNVIQNANAKILTESVG